MQLLSLPQVRPEDVRFANQVIGCKREINVTVGQDQLSLRFMPPPKSPPTGTSLHIQTQDSKCVLTLSTLAILPENELLNGQHLDVVPPELQAVLADVAFAPYFDQFESTTGYPSQIVEISKSTEVLDAGNWSQRCDFVANLKNAVNSQTAVGTLFLPDELVPIFVDLIKQFPLSDGIEIDGIPVTSGLIVGTTQLSAVHLSELHRHDVILMDIGPGPVQNQVVLDFGTGTTWHAVLNDSQLTIEGAMTTDVPSDATENTPDSQPDSRQTQSVEDIDIQLQFEVGQVTLRIAELKTLQPG
ncbi:MAG: hypothetical protein MK102_19110, partial [Fuerstiella sp.]|nr:hypothetical protein [Fuerstiella sp.]